MSVVHSEYFSIDQVQKFAKFTLYVHVDMFGTVKCARQVRQRYGRWFTYWKISGLKMSEHWEHHDSLEFCREIRRVSRANVCQLIKYASVKSICPSLKLILIKVIRKRSANAVQYVAVWTRRVRNCLPGSLTALGQEHRVSRRPRSTYIEVASPMGSEGRRLPLPRLQTLWSQSAHAKVRRLLKWKIARTCHHPQLRTHSQPSHTC